MADGSVVIDITGDASDFKTELANLKSTAQSLAQELAASLSSAMERLTGLGSSASQTGSELDAASEAARRLADQIQQVDGNAGLSQTASEAEELGDAAQTAAKETEALGDAAGATKTDVDGLGDSSQQTKEDVDGLGDSERDTKTALQQLTEKISSQQTELNQLKTEYSNAVLTFGKTSDEAQELASQISTLSSELDENKQAMADAQYSADGLGDSTKKSGDSASGAAKGGWTVFKGVLSNIATDLLQSAAQALKQFAADVVDTGMTFSSSMSNVAALSGATAEELELLETTAREFGASTVFSAAEAADAMGYMALAGWDVQQSVEGLPGVLNLAAASGMGLAEASDMVTDYLSAFGMEAQQSAYFADLLSYAQANSNTTAAALGEAYKNCAANLNAAGQDVETVTSLLEAMANQGKKGSEAGTALSAMMRDITAKMDDGAISIGNTSVAVQDAQGNFRDLTDILLDVEAATCGMGDAERASALSAVFTADSITGLNLILNEGVSTVAGYEEALRSSTGTAEEMSSVMNDNLAGDLKAMGSAFDEVKLQIFEVFEPALRAGTQALTDFFNLLASNWVDTSTIDAVGEAFEGLGDVAEASTGQMVQAYAAAGISISGSTLDMVSGMAETAEGFSDAAEDISESAGSVAGSVEDTLQTASEYINGIVSEANETYAAQLEEMAETIESRTAEITSGLGGLFDEFNVKTDQSTQDLMEALQSQVDGLSSWSENLKVLAARGIDEGLLAELQKMGPGAAAQVELLTTMTDEELSQYSDLWGQKQELVNQQVLDELGLLPEQAGGEAALTADAILEGLYGPLDASAFVGIGDNIGAGLAEGISGSADAAVSSATDLGQQLLSGTKSFFGIQSPSTVMRDQVGANIALGIAEGITGSEGESQSAIESLCGGILSAAQGAMGEIKTAFSSGWEDVATATSSIHKTIQNTITTAWDAIQTTVSTTLSAVKTTVSTGFTAVKTTAETIWNGIKSVISDVWEGIKAATSTALDAISSTVSGVWEAIRSTISSVMDGISSTVSNIWNAISSTISTVLDGISAVVSNVWNTIHSTLSGILDGISSTVSNVWGTIKETTSNRASEAKQAVSEKFEDIRSSISNKLESAKATVTSVFGTIKSTIEDKMNTARDAVKSAIDKMKSFFNFSWSLPKLKLPHVSISGNFSLNPPSVPKFGISWYRKGGVLMEPTIFGASGGTLLAGGEAGPEAVAPIDVLQDYVSEAVRQEISGLVAQVREAVEAETIRVSATLSAGAEKGSGGLEPVNHSTVINVYVDGGGVASTQQARNVGREIGAETAREMRRRGLVTA